MMDEPLPVSGIVIQQNSRNSLVFAVLVYESGLSSYVEILMVLSVAILMGTQMVKDMLRLFE